MFSVRVSLVLGLAAIVAVPAESSLPAPPPPPPPELPSHIDGYEVAALWSWYSAGLREDVTVARTTVFDRLAPEAGEDGELVMRQVYIEGTGWFYDKQTTAAVETVCDHPSVAQPSCVLRMRAASGFLGDTNEFLRSNFDAETAAQYLKQEGITGTSLEDLRSAPDPLLGLPSGVATFEPDIRAAVFTEETCTSLRPLTEALLLEADALAATDTDNRRHTDQGNGAFVQLVTAGEDGVLEMVSVYGAEQSSVLDRSNKFLSALADCLDAAASPPKSGD